MLLGVSGLVDGDWRAIDANVLKKVRQLGFAVLQVRVDDPRDLDDANAGTLKQRFEDHGVLVGQTVGNYGGGLVAADDGERTAAIEFMKRMCGVTAALGAPDTYLRPGSLNPASPWYPHSENRSPEVFDRLVDSARQICVTAESEGVKVAVEGGVVCPLYSARRVKDFIDAAGSPNLGFNMDPVNFVGSIEQAYDTTSLQREFYDLLPDRIFGAHAKDFQLVDALLPRFEEEVIGRGMLDQHEFLTGMQEVCPDGHVLIEHLPDELVPVAAQGMRRAAASAGIVFENP